jgi:hypothetical protein
MEAEDPLQYPQDEDILAHHKSGTPVNISTQLLFL